MMDPEIAAEAGVAGGGHHAEILEPRPVAQPPLQFVQTRIHRLTSSVVGGNCLHAAMLGGLYDAILVSTRSSTSCPCRDPSIGPFSLLGAPAGEVRGRRGRAAHGMAAMPHVH